MMPTSLINSRCDSLLAKMKGAHRCNQDSTDVPLLAEAIVACI